MLSRYFSQSSTCWHPPYKLTQYLTNGIRKDDNNNNKSIYMIYLQRFHFIGFRGDRSSTLTEGD
jgi:hypothetical protein